MFWFMIFNSFDATYLYQYTFILLCNVVFTSLPVIALGGAESVLFHSPQRLIRISSLRPGSQREGSARVPPTVHPWHPGT